MLWNQVRDIMILILVVAMGASAGIGKYLTRNFQRESPSFVQNFNIAMHR